MILKNNLENANSGLRCLAKLLRVGTLLKRRVGVADADV
jgi:hypothetical protein